MVVTPLPLALISWALLWGVPGSEMSKIDMCEPNATSKCCDVASTSSECTLLMKDEVHPVQDRLAESLTSITRISLEFRAATYRNGAPCGARRIEIRLSQGPQEEPSGSREETTYGFSGSSRLTTWMVASYVPTYARRPSSVALMH